MDEYQTGSPNLRVIEICAIMSTLFLAVIALFAVKTYYDGLKRCDKLDWQFWTNKGAECRSAELAEIVKNLPYDPTAE